MDLLWIRPPKHTAIERGVVCVCVWGGVAEQGDWPRKLSTTSHRWPVLQTDSSQPTTSSLDGEVERCCCWFSLDGSLDYFRSVNGCLHAAAISYFVLCSIFKAHYNSFI